MKINNGCVTVPKALKPRVPEADVALLNHDASTIAIRHAEPDDYKALHQLFAEPGIIHWMTEMPLAPMEHTHKRVNDESEDRYMLVACEGGKVIGTLGVSTNTAPLRHVARLGPFAVRTAWQGRRVGPGLMSAALDLADNWLNLDYLELFVYADDEAAIALYTKFGFITEGTLRSLVFRAGQYANIQVMVRPRGESKAPANAFDDRSAEAHSKPSPRSLSGTAFGMPSLIA